MPYRLLFCAAGVSKFPDRRFSAPGWGREKSCWDSCPEKSAGDHRQPLEEKTNAGTLITP
jgi:hypothetical protein